MNERHHEVFGAGRAVLLPRLRRFTLTAAWLGLLTGLLEVAIVYFRIAVLHRPLDLGGEIVWMAPLGDAVVFAAAGTAVALGTWLAERGFRSVPAFGVLVFVSMMTTGWAVVLWTQWLAELPGLLLVAGIAVQVARRSRDREPIWYRLARRWVPTTILLVAALGLGTEALARWTERRRVAALPESPAGAPNILLLVLDTVGARWLSLYGYYRPTSPRMEELAREGVLFERAYATSSWTLPSHGSMFTGRYAHEIDADWWAPLDPQFPVLAEQLGSVGYVTGGFPANQAFGAPAYGLARGFLHYETYPVTWQELFHNTALGRRLNRSYHARRLVGYWQILNRKDAARVNKEFLQWASGVGHRPFFAFLNYFDTHAPYYPPAPYDSLFGPGLDVLPPGTQIPGRTVIVPRELLQDFPPPVVRQLRNAYDGSLAYVDAQIGRLMDELEARGILNNTVVILTADHGEFRGEEGRWDHGASLHGAILHVPLILRYPPKLPPFTRVVEPVTLRDLPATIMHLAGLEAHFPGSSLAQLQEGDSVRPPRSPVFSSMEHYPGWRVRARSVIRDRHNYIQYADGREELFDVVADPLEIRNLLSQETFRPRVAELRQVLDSAWTGTARKPWTAESQDR